LKKIQTLIPAYIKNNYNHSGSRFNCSRFRVKRY